jgi:hypothetical protein
MKIGAGKVVLFLSAPIKSHVYLQTLWHFGSKERLDNVRVLLQRTPSAVVSFRQHIYTDFAALQTSYTVYTRCYVSRFKGSELKSVTSYYIFITWCLIQKKITFYCSPHCIILHYFQVSTPIFLWPFAAIYLFMAYCITCFLFCFFLPSPIISPLLFSYVYLFKALSFCLKCPFFDKCVYFRFRTCPCVCIFWHF